MKEMITENIVDESSVGVCLKRLQKEGVKAWGEVFPEIAEHLNIGINYDQSEEDSFSEKRGHLNSKPGILIANHPSIIDPCFILPAIKRSDVLVMTQGKRFSFLKELLGAKNILRAPTGPKEFKEALVRIREHITSGGLFVLFPSGGKEMKDGVLSFQSGFAEILSNMNPKDMVYSFYIDPDVGREINSNLVGPPRDSKDTTFLIAPELHVRPATERVNLVVKEAYSTAQEWQEVFKGEENTSRVHRNSLLTEHYLEKFSKSR